MRQLTDLLDPGRLRRGVGPHVALGPPLTVGQTYALSIGGGMIDGTGRPLRPGFQERFRATEAVREAVAVEQWQVGPPSAGGRRSLVLTFPRPLDRGLWSNTISVESVNGRPVDGRATVDGGETRWSFTPSAPWGRGTHRVRVRSCLEDVCGNNLVGAFDRQLRPGTVPSDDATDRVVAFRT